MVDFTKSLIKLRGEKKEAYVVWYIVTYWEDIYYGVRDELVIGP